MPTSSRTPSHTLRAALGRTDAPFAAVDVAAFEHNGAQMRARAQGLPIRVASKSLRSVGAIRHALSLDGYAGVLAYSLPEAIALAREGIEDIVVAYPTVHRAALAEYGTDERLVQQITLMIDSVAHLDLIDEMLPVRAGEVRVCIDIDASYKVRQVFIGARRSPLHERDDVLELVRAVQRRACMRLVGLMAYEAQIASVADAGRSLGAMAKRTMRRVSASELSRRRAEIVDAVREEADLEFVNGGGTGCIELSAAEGSLTEVAAGSGFYTPTLFDGFLDVNHRAAAFFALPVTRFPGGGWATLASGGWVASGPAGKDRLPTPVWPEGLRLSPTEGAGEVQTPVQGPAVADLALGDLVWFRHAKAGELCEHVDRLHAVDANGGVTEWDTYRGRGWAFR